MATHTAHVAADGEETIVRISGKLGLPHGVVAVREVEMTGEVILTPIRDSSLTDTWAAFLDDMSQRPRDNEFMKDRPMNRPPVDKNLFTED